MKKISRISWKRRALEWCCVLAGLWLAVALLAGCVVDRLAFHPEPLDASWRPAKGEEIFFEDEDGTRLHGILLKAENPRAVVVHFHGNAGSLDAWQWEGWTIRERLAATVFVWDYPGFGKSGGKPTPASVMSAGRAAVRAASERTGVPPADMILIGRSLGGAVAMDAACHANAAAVVLESSFTSLRAMCARTFRWLPWGLILREPMDSEAKLKEFQGAVFVAHNIRDSIVPFEFGEQLFNAANGPKEFFKGAGDHNDEWPSRYYQVLKKFLENPDVIPKP